jgi:hypothetical protein
VSKEDVLFSSFYQVLPSLKHNIWSSALVMPSGTYHIIYQTTIQVDARNDIAVDSGGCDRSTKPKSPDRSNWCTFVVKGEKSIDSKSRSGNAAI